MFMEKESLVFDGREYYARTFVKELVHLEW